MYQPISFNVIRQALEWHGFPVPTLRQLSFYDFWDDFVSAEYLATWGPSLTAKVTGSSPERDGSYHYAVFAVRLRDCFAEDVTITDLHVNSHNLEMTALIYVKIPKGLAMWERMVEQL